MYNGKTNGDTMPSLSLEKALETLTWKEVPYQAVSTFNKYLDVFDAELEKRSNLQPNMLNTLGQYLNLWRGEYPGGIPNHPAPLASMLVGGLAGAGLGYGLGRLGEAVLPSDWQPGAFRRTGALAGGLLGTMPGALWGAINKADGRAFNDNTLFQTDMTSKPKVEYDVLKNFRLLDSIPAELSDNVKASFAKVASFQSSTGFAGPAIDVDQFIHTVWNDPRVAEPLTPREQAAASGLVYGAANLKGKRSTEFITPWDVARLSAGMGSGYLSGMLVGKALGALVGMPTSAQETLKNTGAFAGIIANLVPIAFGGR